jgi:UPF0042 nucleotide-binding protein
MSDPPAATPDVEAPAGFTADRAEASGPAVAQRLLLIAGQSGAGKTTALKALEDLGYESIDHLPLSLLASLVSSLGPDGAPLPRPLAIGIGVRTHDFNVVALLDACDRLSLQPGLQTQLLFLMCDEEELRRRYTASRHRHPLAEELPLAEGIRRERQVLLPVRERADFVIDTTGLPPGVLKQMLASSFSPRGARALVINVVSFSFRAGLPREADLVFDVRFLRNPYYEAQLRLLTGSDAPVADYITADPDFGIFFGNVTGLLQPLLPRYHAEGKSYLTIAIGCTGGRHRSVLIAERLAAWLQQHNQRAHVHHRDLDKSPR